MQEIILASSTIERGENSDISFNWIFLLVLIFMAKFISEDFTFIVFFIFILFYFILFLLTINLKLIIVHVEIKIVNKEAETKRSALLHAQRQLCMVAVPLNKAM